MPTPKTGQISVSASAQPLSTTPVQGVAYVIKAPSSNINPVYLGPAGVTTANGYQLDPGEPFEYQVAAFNGQARFELSVSDFYVIGTAATPADKVTWLVSP